MLFNHLQKRFNTSVLLGYSVMKTTLVSKRTKVRCINKEEGVYTVQSDNFEKNRIEYVTVMKHNSQWCTCKDFEYRGHNDYFCKHMWRVVSQIVKEEVRIS